MCQHGRPKTTECGMTVAMRRSAQGQAALGQLLAANGGWQASRAVTELG
jgi:hypothetical protein